MSASNTYGRAVDVPMVNKSGGQVVLGDAVIYDTTNNDAFTTTTSTGSTLACGIAQETIASNGTGRIRTLGYTSLATPTASVTRGHYGYIGGVAKQVTDAGASRVAGTFLYFMTGGTTPDAIIYPVDLAGAALTNPMSHVGALIVGGTAGAPTELVIGTATQVLTGGTTPAWAGVPGRILGRVAYVRGTDGTVGSTLSATQVDLDAANALVTFTAPASGNVIVHLEATCKQASNGVNGYFGLRESTTNVVNTQFVTSLGNYARICADLYATGISAGSHTYKFAIAGDGSSTMTVLGGPTFGTVWMAVYEAA